MAAVQTSTVRSPSAPPANGPAPSTHSESQGHLSTVGEALQRPRGLLGKRPPIIAIEKKHRLLHGE